MTTAKIATIMKNKATVSIERDTLNRLKKYGSMDDTYDSVLNRVLDELEDLRRKQSKK
jgi:hypothetical protein